MREKNIKKIFANEIDYLKKIFLFTKILILLLFLTFIFPIGINTQNSDETEFKLFLNNVIQNSIDAKDIGYNFIKKYPNSSFVPDVLYYLSFVETDYFMNLINLKKVVLYYPYSLWREASLIRILIIYFLQNNTIQFEQWYDFYEKNFSIKNRRWEVEILNLRNLYKNSEFQKLSLLIENHLKNAKNINLISYSLLLKSVLLKNKNDLITCKKLLLTALTMFSSSDYYEYFIYELYKISFREERSYFAKALLDLKLFTTLTSEEKEEITKFSKINSNFKPAKIIDENLKRDYFYISLGYSSDIDKIEEIRNKIENLGLKVKVININQTVYQIIIGYFHFREEAQHILKILSENGFVGELNSIEYSY